MEYRTFDNLGVTSSLLGFGCMRFPLNDDGSINEIEAEKMIDLAVSNGVNYIDTAYPYHKGDSEPFVGRVLKKYPRDSFTLATKLPIWDVHSKEDVLKIFNDQLNRLDVDYVDFYLLHALDKEKWETVIKYDILSICDQLKKEGKIKYFGFSFHDNYEIFERILHSRKWDFCQLQLNYMDMDIQAGKKGHDLAKAMGVPIVVMEPIKGGALSSLPKKQSKMFKEFDEEASLSSWALRYVGSLDNVKVILSGMSTLEQVEDNLKTFKNFKPLNREELKLIEGIAFTLKIKTQNGCTGCAYCMPCPFGVNIPNNFRYWNTAHIYEDHETFKKKLIDMKDEFADKCKKCGMCEKMCPQQISIREDLQRVVRYVNEK